MKLSLPSGITKFAGRNTLLLQKKSPTILFAVGVTGFVATTVLASRATLKITDVLEELDEGKALAERMLDDDNVVYDQSDYNQDVATLYAIAGVEAFKLYGPALLCGGISIAALTGSHHILNKRNAGLSAAYAALDKGFTQYRNRVRAELGDEKDREFRHGHETKEITTISEDGTSRTITVKQAPPGTHSIYAKFFDELNVNYQNNPEYNAIFLRAQQNYANDKLRSRGHVFLNEVYDSLGIERTKQGAVVGWVLNSGGDNYIDFGIFNEKSRGAIDFVNGREAAIILDFNVDGVIYDLI
jgi:hypothetical protein